MPQFKQMQDSDLPAHICKGYTYRSFTFNVPVYLTYLHNQLKTSPHITFHQTTLNTYPSGYDLIINCSGLSAGRLDIRETGMYPIRGQTVRVWAPKHKDSSTYLVKPGVFRYAIPRGDGYVILGGTLGVGEFDTVPREEQGKMIVKECVETWKTLEGLQVVDNLCGLRPARKGGLRLEMEKRNGVPIIHNYGHGTSGKYGLALGLGR